MLYFYRTSSGREPAREYIESLPTADRVAIAGDFRLIDQFGILRAPIVARKLIGKLWEIKTGTRHQQRLFYCLYKGDDVLILHACKKQKQGSQREDVDLAFRRMREVLQ